MAENENEEKLCDIFSRLWETEKYLSETDEPMASNEVQVKVKEGLRSGERAVEMINMLSLFSSNEDLEEIATNEIRYLLLPALLGYFTMKQPQQDRLETVQKAKLHYTDFLKLCADYNLTNFKPPNTDAEEDKEEKPSSAVPSHKKDTAALERERNAKIARYKEQKATESRLKELYPLVQEEHVDEDVKREYYVTLVKKWINFSIEELESIESELEILRHMAKMKKEGKDLKPEPAATQQKQPRRPFIITKDKIQKQVFGLGYPSVPTYTIDEFYDRQVELGNVPSKGQTIPAEPSREEEEEKERMKEEKVEKDDAETLKKARDWDEWKDDHRRGWGNTYNQG